MKKLFNASLVALAVAGTFGAQAATISSTPLQMSEQGVAAGLVAENQDLTFDIVVDQEHPASSTITLTFDANVDLDTLAADVGGVVTNDPSAGTGVSGDIAFDYGTGSFTFDNLVIDTTTVGAHTISFDVNLGNPILANSAFRVTLGGTKVDIAGASSLSYVANKSDSTEIETGSGVISETQDQFSYAVTTEYDALIDRTDRTQFIAADDTLGRDDLMTFALTDNATLAAAVTVTSVDVKIAGDFTDLLDADFTLTGGTPPTAVLNADEDELTVNVVAADITSDGTVNSYTVDFSSTVPGTELPITTFVGDVFINGTAVYNTAPYTQSTNVDHGEWALDASVVNVPYLPLGYETLSANVEYSNHSNTDAEVSITAFDNEGTEYAGDLPIAPAHTVTKYSDAQIIAALGVEGSKKLNITFISNADADKVSVVPYYRQGDSRVQTINDQYKGK
ncbi:hypothetical protein OHV10_19125 [Vibrio splendidus]|uniref:hypothetical protein n=1 Tax=Vibrio splendidus TaxID=29497 RepID=UPI0022362041|nr:hypothetical protein [Vibrio splendidus]MCW4446356.1 hypothetical protein [Vibrio splendidus]